jgi:hypothetical protein
MPNKRLVDDKFRTNPLSLEPGGSIVEVVYPSGAVNRYDKVKNTTAFINKILRDPKNKGVKAYVVPPEQDTPDEPDSSFFEDKIDELPF